MLVNLLQKIPTRSLMIGKTSRTISSVKTYQAKLDQTLFRMKVERGRFLEQQNHLCQKDFYYHRYVSNNNIFSKQNQYSLLKNNYKGVQK